MNIKDKIIIKINVHLEFCYVKQIGIMAGIFVFVLFGPVIWKNIKVFPETI